MYNVTSSYNVSYFVFGFLDRTYRNPVIGILNKTTREFIIDHTGKSTADVKEKFLSGDLRLPIVKIDGVENYRYRDIQAYGYVRDCCFILDLFYASEYDESDDGYIVVKDLETIRFYIGLVGDKIWSTEKSYELCDFTFAYDSFFEDFTVDIDTTKNIEVVRKPYIYDDI